MLYNAYPRACRKLKTRQNRKPDSVQQEQVRVRRREGYAAAERRLQEKVHSICCVDENDVIGETVDIFVTRLS